MRPLIFFFTCPSCLLNLPQPNTVNTTDKSFDSSPPKRHRPYVFHLVRPSHNPPFSHNPLPFCDVPPPPLFSAALFSLVNTIAQAVSCCRHFVADHGAESLLPSNCQSVHFMVHIPCSPFVRLPLAPRSYFFNPFPYK